MNQPCARILVVDDEAVIRRTLETMLRRRGYAVWTAADAQEAFTWLREGAFDLLLIDLMLPGRVSGLDIAEGARAYQPETAHPKTAVDGGNSLIWRHQGRAASINQTNQRRPAPWEPSDELKGMLGLI